MAGCAGSFEQVSSTWEKCPQDGSSPPCPPGRRRPFLECGGTEMAVQWSGALPLTFMHSQAHSWEMRLANNHSSCPRKLSWGLNISV